MQWRFAIDSIFVIFGLIVSVSARMTRRTGSNKQLKWDEIVGSYSNRLVSHDSDRLPALSRIAKCFGASHDWTYLAGLWWEDISNLLIWTAHWPHHQLDDCQVPSWSWASVTGSVHFVDMCSQKIINFISMKLCMGSINMEYQNLLN
jgi:hypothetical protein